MDKCDFRIRISFRSPIRVERFKFKKQFSFYQSYVFLRKIFCCIIDIYLLCIFIGFMNQF